MPTWSEVIQWVASAPVCRSVAFAVAAVVISDATAQSAAPAQAGFEAQAPAAPVFTRARLLSVEKKEGNQLYVRLKLLPRSKLPFTTQTFRVMDRALLADIPEGAWVKFTAQHMAGENTVTSIQVTDECKRFQPCD